ncbi:hypothetical protein D3C72_2074590 [compost metagenome]
MRVEMGFRFLDDEERMISLAVRDEPVEFKAFQRQENQVCGAQAGVPDTPRTIVDQQAQATQQGIDPRGRETERQWDRVLLAGDRNQTLAYPLRCSDHLGTAHQVGLRFTDQFLDFLPRILIERCRQLLDQRPQR